MRRGANDRDPERGRRRGRTALETVERKPPLILAVGRLKAPKDFLTLIRALGDLPPASFEATIVGEDLTAPDWSRRSVLSDLTGRVRLVGERRDVPQLLAAADVFVLPSTSEGLPVSVLEAMAAGLPVVASRVGGVPEQVSDGKTGLLVEPGDPNELAAALHRLTVDPSLRRRLGSAGRARAELTSISTSWGAPTSRSTPASSRDGGCRRPRRSAVVGTPRGAAGGMVAAADLRTEVKQVSRRSTCRRRRAKRSVPFVSTPGSHETATRNPAVATSPCSRSPKSPDGYENASTGRPR